MAVGAIRVELELVDGSFTTRILRAGQSIADLERSANSSIRSIAILEQHTTSLGHSVHDLTMTVGLAGHALANLNTITGRWMLGIVKANAEIERLTMLMRGMSKAADPVKDAAQQVDYLIKAASNAPYSLHALTDTFVKLKSAGIDPTTGSMRSLVDAVAAFGGNEDVMKRATVAIQQMAGKGVVSMEELRQQLGEAVPRATELMARGLGQSYAQLVRQISQGKVSARPAIEAMFREFERTFGGAAGNMMVTWDGLVQRMHTEWTKLMLDVGNAGYFDEAKRQLADLVAMLSGGDAKRFAKDFGEGMVTLVRALRQAVDVVIQLRSEIGSFLMAAAGLFVGGRMLQGVMSMVGGMRTLGMELVAVGTAARLASANAAQSAFFNGASATAMNLTASRALLATGAVRGLGVAAGALTGGFGLALAALWAVGDYLDVFRSKVRQSANDLAAGIITQETVNGARERAKDLKVELAAIAGEAERLQRIYDRQSKGGSVTAANQTKPQLDDARQRESEARARLDELRQQIRDAENKLSDERAQRQSEANTRTLASVESRVRAEIDQEKKALADRYELAIKNKELTSIELKRLEDDYQANLKDKNATLFFELTGLWERRLAYLQAELPKLGEQESRVALATIERVKARLNEIRDSKGKNETIDATSDGSSDAEKGQKRFETYLSRLKARAAGAAQEIEDLNVGLFGTTKMGEQLAKLMDEGIFGPNFKNKSNEQRLVAVEQANALGKMVVEAEGLKGYQKNVTGITAKIAEMEAEIAQASGTVGKLAAIMDRGIWGERFKNQDNPLRQQLLDLAKQADDTEKKLKGSKALTEFKEQADQIRLQMAQTGSELSKVQAMADAGLFGKEFQTRGSQARKELEDAATAVDRLKFSFKGLEEAQGIIAGLAGELAELNVKIAAGGAGASREAMVSARLAVRNAEMTARGEVFSSEELARWSQAQEDARTVDQRSVRSFVQDQGNDARTKIAGLGDRRKGVQKGKEAELRARITQHGGNPDAPEFKDDLEAVRRADRLTESTKSGERAADKYKITLDGLNAKLAGMNEEMADGSKEAGKLRSLMDSGAFGAGFKDASNQQRVALLALAEQVDDARERLEKFKKAQTALESLKGISLDMNDREAAARDNLFNPDLYKYSKGYLGEQRKVNKNLRAVEEGAPGGKDSEDYKRAAEQAKVDLRKYRDSELMENAEMLRDKTRELSRSMMTDRAAKEDEFRQESDRMRANLDEFRGTLGEKQKLEELYSNWRSVKLAQINDGPIDKLARSWGDTTERLKEAGAGWLSDLSDRLTTLATTGKATFGDFARAIIADLIKIQIRETMVKSLSLLSGALGFGSGAAGGASAGGAAYDAATAGTQAAWSQFVPKMHTGGIVGVATGMGALVPPGLFANAKRFHTGGFPGLSAGEVPAILKKGEGVFTPEQMSRMGGGQQITQNVTVNVTASGGSPEQNDDLADKVGRQVRDQLKAMMLDEMIRQRRQGGVLAAG